MTKDFIINALLFLYLSVCLLLLIIVVRRNKSNNIYNLFKTTIKSFIFIIILLIAQQMVKEAHWGNRMSFLISGLLVIFIVISIIHSGGDTHHRLKVAISHVYRTPFSGFKVNSLFQPK